MCNICFWWIGQVQVLINSTGRKGCTEPVVVATLHEGQAFGELALTGDEASGVRKATVKSTNFTEVYNATCATKCLHCIVISIKSGIVQSINQTAPGQHSSKLC